MLYPKIKAFFFFLIGNQGEQNILLAALHSNKL